MPENTKNKTEAKDCQKSQNRSDNCKDDGSHVSKPPVLPPDTNIYKKFNPALQQDYFLLLQLFRSENMLYR